MCRHTSTLNSPRRAAPAPFPKSRAAALIAAAILIGGVFGPATSAWAQGQPIVFSVVGDVPYSTSEISEFREHMDDHDLYSASDFLVHVGDIKPGGSTCAESWYRDMATSLRTLSVPGFIVPGDNEWNDCSSPSQAWGYWVKHLMAIEQNFCGLPVVERQTVRPENFAFVKNGVLFIGINMVHGGLGSSEQQTRRQQNADWVTQQLQTKGSTVRALVVFGQASPSVSPFESQFRDAAVAFGKPVLYIHGDGHSWIYDEGYLESNITRVQVERGSISHPPVHVTVTMDPANMFLFERNPWPSNTPPLNRPPCVEAGPDVQRSTGTTSVQLNGRVSDDGEPIPSNVTTTWTHVGGAGIVTFGNRNSPITTAQFSADGSYTLRLTATDGALTTSDTVFIDIGVAPNAAPAVDITTPVSDSEFELGQPVSFVGSASDDFDGNLTASLIWTSNIDGTIGTGGTFSTSALSVGVHTITASVTDTGGKIGSDAITITIVDPSTVPPPSPTVDVRVASSTDDAEESATGSVSLTSSDLELVTESTIQTVGMRFNGVAVPRGTTILNAWIQFQVDQTGGTDGSLTIQGQAVDDALTFTTATSNLSSRPKTTAAVPWSPAPWNTVGAAGPEQQTPNIKSVIQEIVNRPGWSSGNSLAIIITGTGKRTAESYNGVPNGAPLLHIELVPGETPPVVNAGPDQAVYVPDLATLDGTVSDDGKPNPPGAVTTTWSQVSATPAGTATFTNPNAIDTTVSFSDPATYVLRLTANDGEFVASDDVTVTVSVRAPEIAVAPSPYGFGSVTINTTVSGTIAVSNSGSADLQVTATSLSGGQAAEFGIVSGGGSFTVAAGATHNISVSFTPVSEGPKSTTLQLTTNDQDESTVDVNLTGTGSTPPDVDVAPTSHDYGNVAVGTNVTRTFTIRNLGGANLQVSGTSLVGTHAGQFAITSGSGAFTLTAGATRNLDVRFAPTSEGLKTAALRLTSNDPDEPQIEVALNGTGTVAPDIAVTPTSFNFGARTVGTSVTQSFTVSNPGTSNLIVGASTLTGANAGEFAFVSGQAGFTIAPAASSLIQVSFNPSTEGSKSATLTIPSNDPDQSENPTLIPLTGTGVIAGATPPTFEEVRQGGSSNLTTVTTATTLTGVNGHLYVAAVTTKSVRAVTQITGLGLSWTRVTFQCAGRNQTDVELWWAQGAATTGTVTATLESAPTNAAIVVARYSGVSAVNPVATLVTGNTNGVNGACAGGTDSAAYSFNVTTTQNNALVVGAVAMRFKTHTPGAGYTERAEASQGTSSGTAVRVALVDRAVPVASSLTLDGTLNSTTDWAVIGIELRP